MKNEDAASFCVSNLLSAFTALIALDLTLFMVPIVPFLAAYVLLVRPPWFKDFIDDVYDRS